MVEVKIHREGDIQKPLLLQLRKTCQVKNKMQRIWAIIHSGFFRKLCTAFTRSGLEKIASHSFVHVFPSFTDLVQSPGLRLSLAFKIYFFISVSRGHLGSDYFILLIFRTYSLSQKRPWSCYWLAFILQHYILIFLKFGHKYSIYWYITYVLGSCLELIISPSPSILLLTSGWCLLTLAPNLWVHNICDQTLLLVLTYCSVSILLFLLCSQELTCNSWLHDSRLA